MNHGQQNHTLKSVAFHSKNTSHNYLKIVLKTLQVPWCPYFALLMSTYETGFNNIHMHNNN